jgi:hypothetical protein
MPGTIWSQQQLQNLRQQLEKGKWVQDIRVYGKEPGAVRGKAYELGFTYGKKWTREEESNLRRQLETGRECGQISVTDRSLNGIKNKAYRLGLKKPQRQARRWNPKERTSLKFHVQSLNFTARRVFTAQIFSGRSLDAIAQQIKRTGLVHKGSPVKVKTSPYTELSRKAFQFRMEKNCLYLSSGGHNIPKRTCLQCMRPWFATDAFFKRRRNRKWKTGRQKYHLSTVCRLCLAGGRGTHRLDAVRLVPLDRHRRARGRGGGSREETVRANCQ